MRVLITGASRGIGRGIAVALAKRGHVLGLISRTEAALRTLVKEVASLDGTAAFRTADIRSFESTDRAVSELIEELGGVDALINNAGVVLRKNVFDISLEEWQEVIETNLGGVFYATRAVLPHMREQRSGHIINISSVSGRMPLADGSAYAASKFGVTGFSESLFMEVRKHNIKVTTIFPGSVDTESHAVEGQDASWKLQPEEVGVACAEALETSPQNCITRLELRPLSPPGS